MMKHLTALIFSVLAIPAFAQDLAIIQSVYPKVHYEEQATGVVTECRNTAGGDALGGMIIGGLIGKGLTGNDQGAAAGAIIGGVLGAENSNRRQCREIVVYETVQVLDYYEVVYSINGLLRSVMTYRYFEPGQVVPLYVLLQN